MEPTPLQISQGFSEKEKHLGQQLSQVYYDTTGVQLKEDVYYGNFYKTQFPSLVFGGQGIVLNVNAVDLSRQIRIRLVLPAMGANISLPKGWGYHMISRIEYRYASSTTLNLDGEQHLLSVMSAAETANKRDELMDLGGEEVFQSTGAVQPEAVVFIQLPHSHVRQLVHSKPIDNSLLSQGGYQIILYLKPLSQIIGGSGAAAYLAANNSFVAAEYQVETGRIFDQADSIRGELMADPRLSYCYPFIYQQPFTSTFTGAVSPQRSQIQLNGFRSGELLSILFGVASLDDINGDGTVGGVKNALNNLDPLSNVRLTLNGNVLFDLEGKSHRCVGCYKSIDSSYFPASAFTPLTQTTSPFTSLPVKCYFVELNLSTESPKNFEGSRLTGLRDVGNSVINLEFSTATSGQYRLFAIYNYNACLEVKAGTASFVF
jgi:hypothetical protein